MGRGGAAVLTLCGGVFFNKTEEGCIADGLWTMGDTVVIASRSLLVGGRIKE